MITYVNTVLVANNGNSLATHVAGSSTLSDVTGDAGKIAFMNLDITNGTAGNAGNPFNLASIYSVPVSGTVHRFKLGVVTDKYITTTKNGSSFYIPVVKWSNEIKTADIKSISKLNHPAITFSSASAPEKKEDTVKIDFSKNFDWSSDYSLAKRGGFPIIVRLSFKDMPTRYRQWSESYDYYVKPDDTAVVVAAAFADIINKQTKRARVHATVENNTETTPAATVLVLEALPYTDNETADSENFNAKVRFNATAWYNDPLAPGFASSNKYGIGEITKVEGWEYAASAKNVRDRERTAQGYQGILNRSEWYDVKPEMVVNMNAKYSAATIEFENMYRAADDIFRKTKLTVEIYATNSGAAINADYIGGNGLLTKIQTWVEAETDGTTINNSSSYTDEPDAATPEG